MLLFSFGKEFIRMKIKERRDQIVEFVNQHGSISFAALSKEFAVSDMTLRRDLEALDNERRIVRIHGGVKSVNVVAGTDGLFSMRSARNRQAKDIIAQKALQFIRPNTTIFIDSGTTTTALAACMPDIPCLIFTSSLTCAMEFCKLKQPCVYVIGGKLNASSYSINGMRSLSFLKDVNFDVAFMGTTGFAPGRGFSCGSEEEYTLKQQIIHSAEQVIMLMDSQKTGYAYPFSSAQVKDVDVVVSDDQLAEDIKNELEKNGVRVV
jgi:DeoR family transcriptional regulator, aga operon transcriptional repressor